MSEGYQRRWESRRGGRSVSDAARSSYYGAPVLHAPHWGWLVVVYFFLGGIASASYVLASVAGLFGGVEGAPIKRAGRYLSFAALVPCPLLLIFDLGRPTRFLYMFRVLKLRSPMSLGTWGLGLFGAFATLTALIQAAEDGFLNRFGWGKRLVLALPHGLINVVGGVCGFFVGGYTGVLLGITAVPVWAKNALLLGPLFLSSAMSSGSAALTLVLMVRGDRYRQAVRRLERLDLVALCAELVLASAVYRRSGPVIGRPLRQGRVGHLFHWGVLGVGLVVPLVLQVRQVLRGARAAHTTSVWSAFCALFGGLCLRYVMVVAGRESSQDPEATFVFARRTSRGR